jgi:hypothetical protein
VLSATAGAETASDANSVSMIPYLKVFFSFIGYIFFRDPYGYGLTAAVKAQTLHHRTSRKRDAKPDALTGDAIRSCA